MRYRVARELQFIIDEIEKKLRGSCGFDIKERFDESKLLDIISVDQDYNESVVELLVYFSEILACFDKDKSKTDLLAGLESLRAVVNQNKKKIKIAFIVHEYSLWPSFQSIWESCGESIDKEIVFVYSLDRALTKSETERYVEPYRNEGYAVKTMDEYSIQEEKPDVIFYMKPYRGFRGCPSPYYITDAKKTTPYTVFVSYCLDVQGGKELENYFYGMPFFYHVWKIIGYSKYYLNKMIEKGYRNAENVVLIGHPKFDAAYLLTQRKQFIHSQWQKKIQARKVVLWNTHFSVTAGKGVGTYFRWKDIVIDYFRKHKDMVLLWRPHPLFWEQIIKEPGINNEAYHAYIHELEQEDNIIIDKSGDYRYAFCMSDALISDAATFLVEYAASSKPILYTVKHDGEQVCCKDYLAGIRIAEQTEDMIGFLEDIRNNNICDEDCKRSFEMFEHIFGKCDGKIGERILQYVINAVDQDIRSRAIKRVSALEAGNE